MVPLGKYNRAHPEAAYLIVEVAETSLAIDRVDKQRIYAQAGIPEYWIVNLVENCIEVHTQPDELAYGKIVKYGRQDSIRLSAFSDVEIRVSDVILD